MLFYFNLLPRWFVISIFFLSLAVPLEAIEISAYYSSLCNRQLGITVKVEEHNIFVLNLKGKVVKIPRYGIVAVATYPLDVLTISKFETAKTPINKYFKVSTFYNQRIVHLVSGYPINFSKEKISFLTLDGKEVVISKRSIWDLELIDAPKEVVLNKKFTSRYEFIHPSNSVDCPTSYYGLADKKSPIVKVRPQEYVSNSVTIKRRLDFIVSETGNFVDYMREKKFYPIPEIYKNKASLGFWFQSGGHHGSNDRRNANGVPILETQFSSDVFGFQSISYTGSSPNKYFLHEEIQNQIFYRFKADYLHVGLFLDPTILLLTKENYNWQAGDLQKNEERQMESFLFEWGLDFGNFSFMLVSSTAYGAIKDDQGKFYQVDLKSYGRFGVEYRNHLLSLQLFYSSSKDRDNYETMDYQREFFRLNFDYNIYEWFKLQYSLINRNLKIIQKGKTVPSTSLTNAIYGDYQINYKYSAKAMVSLERQKVDGGKSNITPKFGVNFSINL